tara:strand:+ start:403 stop:1113 length:711 start_codon:yes stop_codon:yes gene_type:complete
MCDDPPPPKRRKATAANSVFAAIRAMDAGEPPGAWPTLTAGGTWFQKTLLGWATYRGNLEWTRACLRAGQSANATPGSLHPLLLALSIRSAAIAAELLLEGGSMRGADPETADEFVRLLAGLHDPSLLRLCVRASGGIPAAANPRSRDYLSLVAMLDPTCNRGDPPQFVAIPRELGAVKALPPGSPAWYRRIAAGQRARVRAFACCARHLQPRLPSDIVRCILRWLEPTAQPPAIA